MSPREKKGGLGGGWEKGNGGTGGCYKENGGGNSNKTRILISGSGSSKFWLKTGGFEERIKSSRVLNNAGEDRWSSRNKKGVGKD